MIVRVHVLNAKVADISARGDQGAVFGPDLRARPATEKVPWTSPDKAPETSKGPEVGTDIAAHGRRDQVIETAQFPTLDPGVQGDAALFEQVVDIASRRHQHGLTGAHLGIRPETVSGPATLPLRPATTSKSPRAGIADLPARAPATR